MAGGEADVGQGGVRCRQVRADDPPRKLRHQPVASRPLPCTFLQPHKKNSIKTRSAHQQVNCNKSGPTSARSAAAAEARNPACRNSLMYNSMTAPDWIFQVRLCPEGPLIRLSQEPLCRQSHAHHDAGHRWKSPYQGGEGRLGQHRLENQGVSPAHRRSQRGAGEGHWRGNASRSARRWAGGSGTMSPPRPLAAPAAEPPPFSAQPASSVIARLIPRGAHDCDTFELSPAQCCSTFHQRRLHSSTLRPARLISLQYKVPPPTPSLNALLTLPFP